MFADIVGSTHLYSQLGDPKAEKLISSCLSEMSNITTYHQGCVIKTIGDEIMCQFSDAENAARAAIEIQQSTFPSYSSQSLNIRIGLHFGSILEKNNDIYGDAVNMAARIVTIAKSKQIIATKHFTLCLADKLTFKTRFFDNAYLKGINKNIDVYQILWEKNDTTTLIRPQDAPSLFKENISILLKFNNEEKIYSGKSMNSAISIGRDEMCDININANFISRSHLNLEFRRGKFVLIDHSSNGTYIKLKLHNKIFIRREELPLIGEGYISLGGDYQENNARNIYFKLITSTRF